jgi:glutamate dehydrogenase (NAD(P)+)
VHNPSGLDVKALVEWKQKKGSLEGFPGATAISNEKLLELDVAVLFPAALENTITDVNASRISAKIICELANGPTTPEADVVLARKGIFVIPDFLANAGGVTVSYFEQVQNAYNYYWNLDLVYSRLDEKMTKGFNDVYAMHERHKVNMREAAYLVSVSRVAEACKQRGWV